MERERSGRTEGRGAGRVEQASVVGKQTLSERLAPGAAPTAATGAGAAVRARGSGSAAQPRDSTAAARPGGPLPRLELGADQPKDPAAAATAGLEPASGAPDGERDGSGWGSIADGIRSAIAAVSEGVTKGATKVLDTLARIPEVTHSTADTAPGAPNTRTTVGVGELVTFNSNLPGTWTADGAAPSWPRTSTGDSFMWAAMSTAGTAKISFVPDDTDKLKVDITMTVLAPTVDYLNARATAFPGRRPGVAGAQMDTDVTFGPATVSFANTMWWEQPGPATGATGYFASQTLPFHNPNPQDMQIDTTNSGVVDSAGFWGFTGPYSAGSFNWVIPTYYKVVDGSRTLIRNVTQRCTIAADGTMTVAKGSSSTSRTP